MTVLGLDYGSKRLGLAVAASAEVITPLSPLNSVNWETLAGELAKIITSYQVTKIVVGSVASPAGTTFVKFLTSHFKLPVVVVDERNSSLEALAEAVELGVPRGERNHLDSLAAAIILKRYLLESEAAV